MANNSRQITQRIKTTGNISKITKAMEMVSASKMKRAQDQALATRPYTRALQASLSTVASATSASHPLLTPNTTGVDVMVLISTDKGLCGSLNQNLFKKMIEWLKSNPGAQIVAIGKKAVHFSRIYDVPLYAQFTELPEVIKFSDIIPITTLVQQGYISKSFKSVTVVYMDFISTLVQKVRLIELLPIPKEHIDEGVIDPGSHAEYMFEPSAKILLSELLPYYVENTIYQAFLEARASEHSARMVSMKNASENANQLKGDLQLLYNKSRQESITNELLDITTASLAQT